MKNEQNQNYECTLIIRPNLSEQQAKSVAKDLYPFIKENGTITSAEYWGFKTLAYKVKKNTKAHYVSIGFSSSSLKELYEHLKFNQNVLRFLCVKCPGPLQSPSAQFVSYVDNDKSPEKDENKTAKISTEIDYKNIRLIKKHLTEHGKIVPAYVGKNSRLNQKKIATAIKRARILSLLPYVVK